MLHDRLHVGILGGQSQEGAIDCVTDWLLAGIQHLGYLWLCIIHSATPTAAHFTRFFASRRGGCCCSAPPDAAHTIATPLRTVHARLCQVDLTPM